MRQRAQCVAHVEGGLSDCLDTDDRALPRCDHVAWSTGFAHVACAPLLSVTDSGGMFCSRRFAVRLQVLMPNRTARVEAGGMSLAWNLTLSLDMSHRRVAAG